MPKRARREVDQIFEHGCLVFPNIYLGDATSSKDGNWLVQRGIKVVINVSSTATLEADKVRGVKYNFFSLEDSADEARLLEVFFESVLPMMIKARVEDEAVLVHCRSGRNR